MKTNTIRIIPQSILKIIGIVLMTIDHIGMLFIDGTSAAYPIFRSVGRLAMPIFIFIAMEGVYHTRNIRNYILKLLGLGLIIDVVLYFFEPAMMGNMMIDLGLGVLTIYLLKKKNLFSLFALLPIAYLVMTDIPINGHYYIFSDYGTFGISIFIMFFLAYELTEHMIVKKSQEMNIDYEIFREEKFDSLRNIACSIALVTTVILFYVIYRIDYSLPIIPDRFNTQSWCMFAALLFPFYSGKRGYNALWFKYFFYLYYPLHIAILYGIQQLIR